VSRGLPVAAALEQTVDELRAAGGSFKKLQQQRQRQQGGNPACLQLKSMPLRLDFDVLEGLDA
jgi:hypothetical protein